MLVIYNAMLICTNKNSQRCTSSKKVEKQKLVNCEKQKFLLKLPLYLQGKKTDAFSIFNQKIPSKIPFCLNDIFPHQLKTLLITK